MNLKGDLGLMREMNRGLILSIIQKIGPLSRAELAKRTSLNPSTITRIVADLISEGYITEIGLADSQGGRKPVLLDLVPDAVNVVGIDVEVSSIIGVLSNLKGGICGRVELPNTSYGKQGIVDTIKGTTNQLLKAAKEKGVQVVGIGVAMHGLVDSDAGIALFPPAFGWKNLELARILKDAFGIPVYLENNARAMALGELWFGNGKGISDFVCLKVGQGIGSGIILKDMILRGVDYSVGEIGHTTVLVDGPLCDCGNYGCLESLASTRALVFKAKRHLKEGVRSEILKAAGGNIEAVRASHIYQAARDDDSLALQLLSEIGKYLGIAVANVVNILNPTKILVGGDIIDGLEFVLPTLREIIQVRAMELPGKRVLVEPVKLKDNAAAVGAVTLVLERIFQRSEKGV